MQKTYLILCLFLFWIPNINAATLKIRSVSGQPGAHVDVKIYGQNLNGLAGLSAKINWDSDKVVCKNIQCELSEFTIADSIQVNSIGFSIASASGLTESEADMFTLSFQIDGSIEIGREIRISWEYISGFDDKNQPIFTNSQDGYLGIVEPSGVYPNPFTPGNNDGFNDRVMFNFSDMVIESAILSIYNLNGRLIKSINMTRDNPVYWDGTDDNATVVKPGVYVYILETNKHEKRHGTITVIR